MKSFLIIAASFVLLISGCRKNKPVNPIDQLPPETQTGANTFGCLVNGEVFKPGGASLSGGSLQCNYQLLPNNGYYFVLIGRYRNNNNGSGSSVGLYTDSLNLIEGAKFNLKTRINGNPSASYSFYTSAISLQSYETDGNLYKGELWIKKLDTVNQIVSGTFWFDAVNTNGQKTKIREGRFDMRYTR
ncbi:MAG: hypothetical protein Q8K66_09950 [Sediminibacterium sp.]|nr:hypothetical protein [Sediminibacterium sp.]MDP3127469.1 hypothetical protein [Sediminibacterium sp.]